MLDNQDFENWCQCLNLSQTTVGVIAQIRSSAPSRRVQGGKRNVCGNYPSRKMGVTIQFESHQHELARIYELEHDPNILEYYDQPPPIELCYYSKSGRQNRHLYTPDLFIIRTDSAGWEECKCEQDLVRLSENSPNRYRKEDGQWRCPPGEEYAGQLGLSFRIWSSADISWTFQQNFIWLEDYLTLTAQAVDEQTLQRIRAIVETNPGISLADLFVQAEFATKDDFYTLIALGHLYVQLDAARLSEPQQVQVFLNREMALAYERLTKVSVLKKAPNFQLLQVAVGTSISWDGECWDIVNTGATSTGLLRSDGKFAQLPNIVFEKLVQEGKITASQTQIISDNNLVGEILRRARPQDIVEANRRYSLLQPYLSKYPPAGITRTIRRWRNAYQQAEDLYSHGYIGLLPKHSIKGNRNLRLDEAVMKFMTQFIQENYETLKQRGQLRVYESFQAACESHIPRFNPPSFNRFCLEIRRRSGYDQTLKREGHRSAANKVDFYWKLELTTPRHGERPFEIAHIDHTQLDIELVSSLAFLDNCKLNTDSINCRCLGRPWATFMLDAMSRRLLAVYLSFDEPSYRSCMMVLRICVQRFRRLPQIIVVDNGKEFHSHYFEQLLAAYVCTKKHRPPSSARFGSVVERLFGTANTQLLYELQGNTQIVRKHRQVTKSVNPEKQAIWTLGELYEALCEWAYEIYDQREHPCLGQSPRHAFDAGIALGGSRLHRRVEYDDTFCILTLPTPEHSKRKVQPGRGVKIHNIYYWSNAFRDPEIELSSVEVRYDPFDAGIAYALVRGQWVQCISNYYQYLQGRSEKEIRLLSTELCKRKREQGRNTTNSDRELVQFLNTVEAKEQRLVEQRLKTTENQNVLQRIELSWNNKIVSAHQNSPEIVDLGRDSAVDRNEDKGVTLQPLDALEGSNFDNIEYYGEF